MVLISLKSNNNDGFLYETTTSTKVDDLINELVEIHNARLLACLISDAVKALAMHGVMKRPEGYAARNDDQEEEVRKYLFPAYLDYFSTMHCNHLEPSYSHHFIFHVGNDYQRVQRTKLYRGSIGNANWQRTGCSNG